MGMMGIKEDMDENDAWNDEIWWTEMRERERERMVKDQKP